MNAIDCIPLYSFESAIEAAVQAVLAANDLVVYTSFSAPELDPPRQRPRVEIAFQTGAATGHRTVTTEVYRPDCFTGNCMVTVVTNTNDAENAEETPSNSGAKAHADYRAVVRYLCAGIETTLTDDAAAADTLLPKHSVNRFIETGTTQTIKTEDGLMVSQLNFEVHFNIRPAAWPG